MKTFAACLLAATVSAGAGHAHQYGQGHQPYSYGQDSYSYKPSYQKVKYQPTATTQWQPTVKPYQPKYEVPYYNRKYEAKKYEPEYKDYERPTYNRYWKDDYNYQNNYLKNSYKTVQYVDPSAIDYGKVGTNHGHVNDDATVVLAEAAIGEKDAAGNDEYYEEFGATAVREGCDCKGEYCADHAGDDADNLTQPIQAEPDHREPVSKYAKALSWAHGHKTCHDECNDHIGQKSGAHHQYTCDGPAVYSRAHLGNPYKNDAWTYPVYGASWGHGRDLETMGGHGYGDRQGHGYIANGYGRPGWGHLPRYY